VSTTTRLPLSVQVRARQPPKTCGRESNPATGSSTTRRGRRTAGTRRRCLRQPPCTSITFRIVATTPVQLRGAALTCRSIDEGELRGTSSDSGLPSLQQSPRRRSEAAPCKTCGLGIALKGSSAPRAGRDAECRRRAGHFTFALLSAAALGSPSTERRRATAGRLQGVDPERFGACDHSMRSASSRRSRTPHGNRDGAQLLVRMLKAEGVRHLFTLSGCTSPRSMRCVEEASSLDTATSRRRARG